MDNKTPSYESPEARNAFHNGYPIAATGIERAHRKSRGSRGEVEYATKSAEGITYLTASIDGVTLVQIDHHADEHDSASGVETYVVGVKHDWAVVAGINLDALDAIEARLMEMLADLRKSRRGNETHRTLTECEDC
jgi:hypothetical protein